MTSYIKTQDGRENGCSTAQTRGWNEKVTVIYVSRLNREATATHINRSRQKIYVTQVVEECDKLYKRGIFTTRRRWEKTQM